MNNNDDEDEGNISIGTPRYSAGPLKGNWVGFNQTNFELVSDFHTTFCPEQLEEKPTLPSIALFNLRKNLILEETNELIEAYLQGDIVEIADALTDLLYVVYGAGLAFGIDLDACFQEVHDSNMSKLDSDGKVIRREDGKVLKGPNFRKPDLKKVLGIE